MEPVPVGLLSVTQVNWKEFINAAHEAVGYSPTRGLDACLSPTHRDPAAFVACLDLQNKPLEALRHGRERGLFCHYFMSFICVIDEATIRHINEQTRLATWSTSIQRGQFFTVLSGTMDQWHDAIVTGCRIEVPWEFRSTMNSIYNIIVNAGFKEAFPYKKIENQDRTFSLDH